MRLRVWLVAGVAVAGVTLVGIAGGSAVTRRLSAAGTAAVTNDQLNSSWVTVAVLYRFDAAATGVTYVRRVSQGNTYLLGGCSYTAATNLAWVADCAYAFGYGDVLVIESTATNGVVQVMRKAE